MSGGADCKIRYWRLPATAQDLIAALGKNDLDASRTAARDLDTMGPDARLAFAALVKALKHDRADFRDLAAEALLQFRDLGPLTRAEAADLGRLLERGNGEALRRLAAASLARLGRDAEPACAALANGLQDTDADVRRDAARALAAVGPAARDAVPDLAALLRTEQDATVLAEAAQAIGAVGVASPETVAALAARADHADAAVRLRVLQARASLGPSVLPLAALLKSVQDPDRDIAHFAEQAVDARVRELSAADLGRLLERGNEPGLRRLGAAALARRGRDAEPACAALTDGLKDADAVVRRDAARALTAVGPPARGALPALAALLREEQDGVVLAEAIQAVGAMRVASPEVLDALAARADHPDAAVRLRVLQARAGLGPRALPLTDLLRSVEDPDRDVSRSAEQALNGRMKHVDADDVPGLRQALKSRSPGIRRAAAEGLGNLGDKAEAAAGDLAPLLKGGDEVVRLEAAIALLRVSPKHPDAIGSALPELVSGLRPRSPEEARQPPFQQRCERIRASLKDVGPPAARCLLDAVVPGGPLRGNTPVQQSGRIEVYRALETLGPAAKGEQRRLVEAVREERNALVAAEVRAAADRAWSAVVNGKP